MRAEVDVRAHEAGTTLEAAPLDLALGAPGNATRGLFLVAPDDREDDVRAQLVRPAFRRVRDLEVRYLPYSELENHRDAMARFGTGLKAIEAVARTVV